MIKWLRMLTLNHLIPGQCMFEPQTQTIRGGSQVLLMEGGQVVNPGYTGWPIYFEMSERVSRGRKTDFKLKIFIITIFSK